MPVVRFRTTQVSGKSILRGHDRIYQVTVFWAKREKVLSNTRL